eukprot:GFUD01108753.1.p2 GENE.GFUD01108753.1~~GFUD01108753.1.p2  ORF type:complete len:181 (-),score=48.77 GFUD01108753.1:116-658(-)
MCAGDGNFSPKAAIKSLFSLLVFVGICGGVVYLLVHTSNAKHARGGNGFGVSWSGSDRAHDATLNSNFFTKIQQEGGWKHTLLGLVLFLVACCVCCPFCCRYIFPLILHLIRGGKWGESQEEFEERRLTEKLTELMTKMEENDELMTMMEEERGEEGGEKGQDGADKTEKSAKKETDVVE